MSDLPEVTKESRDRILEAAEELFSDQGFDGTSVNSIAKKAEVNKALIYYYFKSKDDILKCLFETLVDDITQVLTQDVIQEIKSLEVGSFFKDEFIDAMMIKYMDFFVKRRNIMRVMVVESLKKGENGSLLFRFTDYLNSEQAKSTMEALEQKGVKFQIDNNGILVGKFFMGFIPMINYAIYYDRWKEYYNMTDEEFKTHFIKMYRMSYDGYKRLYKDTPGSGTALPCPAANTM